MSQATWKKTAVPLTPRVIRLLREVALYLLAAIGVYLLIALWTYQPDDPSWSHRGASAAVENGGGRVGAWLSDLLFHLFGYVAYLFPVMIAVGGWRIYLHRNDPAPASLQHRLIVGGGFVLAILGACGLASLHYAQSRTGMPFASGGWAGNGVGLGLASAFSFTGATLFLLALFLSGVTLFTGISWLRLMDATGRAALDGFAWTRDFVSAQYDRILGMRARKQRQETVKVEKKVLAKHPPPRIEPVVVKPQPSKRVERERQVPLFETPGAKELPPLSLLDPAGSGATAPGGGPIDDDPILP